MAYFPMIQRGGLGSYAPMVQRGGLGHSCCEGCCEGCAGFCEGGSGLGLVIPSSSSDSTLTSEYPPVDMPTSAPDIAQQILEGAINFVPPTPNSVGPSILSAVATGASFVPGVGTLAASVTIAVSAWFGALRNWLHLGAGATEANLITGPPDYIQNKVFDQIKAIAARDLNGNPSISQLQADVIELQQLAAAWLTFLSNTTHFHDGRASVQAADTIMPYLDGTCGYHWPPPLVPDFAVDCGTTHPTPEGNAWSQDWGYGSGLLGVIKKKIIDNGGQLPALTMTQGVTSNIPSLTNMIPGLPYVPQSGTLPPAATYQSWGNPGQTSQQGLNLSPILIGGGLLALTLL